MIVKKLNAILGSYDPYTRSVEIIASTTNPVEGVALKSWDLSRFQKNPAIFWGHKTTSIPVGLARDVTFDDGGLRMRVYFGSEKANPCAEQLSHCVAEGLVRAVSVGYTEEGDTNILDEVSFVGLGLDEDAGTEHIALDHPINEGVVKRAITPYAVGFENATAVAAQEQATNRPAPPLPIAALAISVIPPKDLKPEIVGDSLARFIKGADDGRVEVTRDLADGDDEEAEERMHRNFRDAARTLRLHYARVKRAEAEGMSRADCLELFDRGLATIYVESPKGDEHFDKGWLGLFGGDNTPASELSSKAKAATAKADEAGLHSESLNGRATSAHESFSRGETSLKGETMGAESFEIPNHAADVIGKYKEAIEASDAAARAHDAASAAHQKAADKHGAEHPEGISHGNDAVAHANIANGYRTASVGMRDSIAQVKSEAAGGVKSQTAGGGSAHSFLAGLGSGGGVMHASSSGGGGGHSGQSRDEHGRWDAADCDHFDMGRLGKVDRTQVGGARVPARLSRTGVLTYRNPDGSVRRELRLASEIFKADSLKTLEHAPVIDIKDHTGMVTPQTWRNVSLGHVTGVRQEGKFIVGDLLVQDQHTLDGIDNSERTEVSLGYRCVLDMTPGVYEGEPYDCVQRSIRYNHAALCPPNRGRAGSEVGLRLDSQDQPATAPSFWWSTNLSQDEEGETIMTVKVRVDGRDFDFGSEAHVEKLNEVIKNTRLDAKEATDKLAAESKRADIAEGERDSLKAAQEKLTLDTAEATAKADADKPAYEEMQKERRRHRRKMERIALRFFGDDSEGDDKTAAPVTGNVAGPDKNAPATPPGTPGKQQKRDFPPGAKAPPFGSKDGGKDEEKTDSLEALEERIDSMSDRDLLVFCIGKRVENFDATGKSDDYLQARFDGIVEVERAGRGIQGVVEAVRRGVQNLDAVEDDEVSKARRKRDQIALDAWKTTSAK